ncbi:hypothetical protein V1478_010600 [Vespula squamosa]|uniref:Uncharacterized protein n=1 Tax=Vespula squamosa TaxID=30214 RepID=A0ABD2AI93_VESSQ
MATLKAMGSFLIFRISFTCLIAIFNKFSSDGSLPKYFSNHAPPIITVSTWLLNILYIKFCTKSLGKIHESKITPRIGRFSPGGTRKPKAFIGNTLSANWRLTTATVTIGIAFNCFAKSGCCSSNNFARVFADPCFCSASNKDFIRKFTLIFCASPAQIPQIIGLTR